MISFFVATHRCIHYDPQATFTVNEIPNYGEFLTDHLTSQTDDCMDFNTGEFFLLIRVLIT